MTVLDYVTPLVRVFVGASPRWQQWASTSHRRGPRLRGARQKEGRGAPEERGLERVDERTDGSSFVWAGAEVERGAGWKAADDEKMRKDVLMMLGVQACGKCQLAKFVSFHLIYLFVYIWMNPRALNHREVNNQTYLK